MNPNASKPVGIWIRVSTEDQARGDSPEHHEKRARHYAEAKGWQVREVYHLEAVSGKSVIGHPEAKKMLEHIRSGHITGLIFSKLARLARNTRELLDFADLFRESDADLISLQESIDTSTPAGRLFYTMIAAMAQWAHGQLCAFQLKGGNVTLTRWRDEVKREVEELIDLTVVHPSVPAGTPHLSFLVTNGVLEDTVRLAVDNLNNGKWSATPLTILTRGELVSRFLVATHDYAPLEVTDYRHFLDLYLTNGRELIEERRFSEFVHRLLRVNEPSIGKEERRRNISTAILVSSYVTAPYFREGNYISVIRALVLLGAGILCLADRHDLEEKYWGSSFSLLWDYIAYTAQQLQSEIASDGLASLVTDIWDGELGAYRRDLASSHLLAFKLSQLLRNDPGWFDIFAPAIIPKLQGTIHPWGEAALFSLFLYHWLLLKAQGKIQLQPDAARKPLLTAVDIIIERNGRRSEFGLLTPYYGIDVAVKLHCGLFEGPMDETFVRRSYLIEPAIDLVVRRGYKAELEQRWRDITYIQHCSFSPAEPWQIYLWRSDKGNDFSAFFQQTQSWERLEASAGITEQMHVPQALRTRMYFLPFFLLVFPHRVTSSLVRFLDDVVVSAAG